MQPVEIRLIDDVVVDEQYLPDAKAGKEHCHCAAGAAAADDANPQLSQVLIERGPEGEGLPVERAYISAAVPRSG